MPPATTSVDNLFEWLAHMEGIGHCQSHHVGHFFTRNKAGDKAYLKPTILEYCRLVEQTAINKSAGVDPPYLEGSAPGDEYHKILLILDELDSKPKADDTSVADDEEDAAAAAVDDNGGGGDDEDEDVDFTAADVDNGR